MDFTTFEKMKNERKETTQKVELKRWKNLLKELERDEFAASMGSREYHYPDEAWGYVMAKIKEIKSRN